MDTKERQQAIEAAAYHLLGLLDMEQGDAGILILRTAGGDDTVILGGKAKSIAGLYINAMESDGELKGLQSLYVKYLADFPEKSPAHAGQA